MTATQMETRRNPSPHIDLPARRCLRDRLIFRFAWPGILVVLALSRASLAQGTPSTSKISLHKLIYYTAGAHNVVNAHPRVIKVLDLDGGSLQMMRDYKASTPEGKTVLRIYTTHVSQYTDDPVSEANYWWNNILGPPINSLSPSDRALLDYIEGPNEGDSTPTWASHAHVEWYNAFWMQLAQLIANNGFQPCAYSISVGNPPGDQAYIQGCLDRIVPSLRLVQSLGGAWSYHSYTIPYTTDLNQEIWYSLRYRQYYAYFASNYPDLVNLPLILTEGGVDGQSAPGGPGWKVDTAQRYTNWLEWYDGQIAADSYVLGVTLFQSGDNGQWNSFETEPITGWLTNWLNTHQPSSPLIHRSPASLTPSCTEGANASNQTFIVQNAGSGTLSYSITDDASWLSVSPVSDTSTGEEDTITVTYSTSSLGAGTYTATITISAAGAGNSPQTIPVTLTVNPASSSGTEDFETMPAWSSTFDATWGNAANWAIVSSGQAGNCLQAQRTGMGSSVKAKVFNINPNTNYTVSVWIRCPAGSAYWAETGYRLGNHLAQDFDTNPVTWTLIEKFASDGTNGNGDTWVQYSKPFNSGADTQVTVGYKLGSSSGAGPTVRWDTFRLTTGTGTPTITRSPSALSPSCTQGSNAGNQSFSVQNTGTGTLNYTITDNQTWLSVSPASGTSTGEADTITVSYSTSGLAVGTYNATITISDPSATNNPQTIAVTLTVNRKTVAEDFNSMPGWSSSFDAPWGGAATWSIVGGGQSGSALQTTRANNGSSAKVKVYDISPNTNYTISVYIRCPSSSSSYWAECAYKLGSFTASDFDGNAGTWTLVKKFSNPGTNGNGNTWTQYSLNFNSGSNTQISVGYKLGVSGGTAPTVQWDTLRVQ